MEKWKERNYGVDLLRVLATLFITILHVMGHGGIIDAVEGKAQYNVIWFLEILCFCAVDCYGVISGYVGYGHKHRPSRYLTLWLEVVFYCLLMTIVVYNWQPSYVSHTRVVHSFFPVTFNAYWYFTAYTGVFLLMPYMNRVVDSFTEKDAVKLFLGVFLLFSLYNTLAIKNSLSDPFRLAGGYTFMWLCALYMVGAVIRKFDVCKIIHPLVRWGVFLLALLFTWLWKTQFYYGKDWDISGMFISYTSPTIFLMATALLLFFGKCRLHKVGTFIVKVVAPTTFGVYLLQDQNYVRTYFLSRRYEEIAAMSPGIIPLRVIGIAISIYVVGIAVDWVRIFLFRFLTVKKLRNWIDHLFD